MERARAITRRRATTAKRPPGAPLTSETIASEAIPRLIETHGDRLMGLALRLTRSRHEAEDLVQETFAQAFRKWETFRGESDPGTWLYTIAVRLWRKKSRRARRVPRSLTDLAPFKDSTVADLSLRSSPTLEDIPAKREAIGTMERAIASLPDEFRLAIVLKDILELETDDVAAALGIKPQTVKTRVHRARLLLRAKLMSHVPQRNAPAPIYEKQVCFDLLRAKLDAMDAGRGFPIGQSVVCERCRAVFAELDLTQNVCAALSAGTISGALERRLRAISSGTLERTERRAAKGQSGNRKVR